MSSTVHLINKNWNVVTVEVRKGNNAEPTANPSAGSRLLQRNEDWRISTDDDIWYRRDANPDGTFTLWTHRPVYPGNPQDYTETV